MKQKSEYVLTADVISLVPELGHAGEGGEAGGGGGRDTRGSVPQRGARRLHRQCQGEDAKQSLCGFQRDKVIYAVKLR